MEHKKITFDEIMNYHKDNRGIFDDIIHNLNSIVPFVGAGMSAFVYPLWRGFLEDVFKKLRCPEKKEYFIKMLDEGYYEEAATFLKSERGIANFNNDIKQAFAIDKLKVYIENNKLQVQAVYLLPMLFRGLVLTTNFDRVLESVYDICKTPFSSAGHPGHNEMLNWALRIKNQTTLYKFHGDISEVGKLTLTKESYDAHYDFNSDLVRELKKCFEQKIILFLGCSLGKDRTMTVLNEALEDGMENFAIINCDSRKKIEVSRNLANRGIRAILYPTRHHESVRVILERLLELTNSDMFYQLRYYESKVSSVKVSRFHFSEEPTAFFGREEELKKLLEFCVGNSEDIVKWWAITGVGGSGKSRLVHEFKKRLNHMDWNIVPPYQYDFSGLMEVSKNLTKSTLFVIDYVQAYAKDIGKWIEVLYNTKSSIIKRIILIDRSGQDVNDYSWVMLMKDGTKRSQSIIDTCHDRSFMCLNKLEINVIKSIMRDYSKNYNSDLSDAVINKLANYLETIDIQLRRPLYALFLVDAWIQKKEPLNWDKNDMLEYVIEREIQLFKNSLTEVVGFTDEKLLYAFLRIKIMATMLSGLNIEREAPIICKEDWYTICTKSDKFNSAEDMLLRAGLINLDRGEDYIVSSLQPSLIGEYLVLRELIRNRKNTKSIVNLVWQKPISAVSFFNRLFQDYYYIIKDEEYILSLLLEPYIEQDNKIQLICYSNFLVNITNDISDNDLIKLVINRLKELAYKNQNIDKIALFYAIGLVNLSFKHDDKFVIANVVEELRQLANRHPRNEGFAVTFAKGLVNLSRYQNLIEIEATIKEIRKIVSDYANNEELKIILAGGLVNLSLFQNEEETIKIVKELRKLKNEYPQSTELAAILAGGLVSLTFVLKDYRLFISTINELIELANEYPENEKMNVELARGLLNLLHSPQTEVEIINIVNQLELIANKYPNNEKLLVTFAKGLGYLFLVKNNKVEQDLVLNRLRTLSYKYPQNTIIMEIIKEITNIN